MDAYDRGTATLSSLWATRDSVEPSEFPESTRAAVDALTNSSEKSIRYSLLNQTLLKAVAPNRSSLFLGNADGYSARSFAKAVVVPFERTELHGALGGSGDPYVSNPLRVDRGHDSLSRSTHTGDDWGSLLELLEHLESEPDQAEDTIRLILQAVEKRVLSLGRMLEQLVRCQQSWLDETENAVSGRRDLTEQRGPLFLEAVTPNGWKAQGGEGKPPGTAEIPWIRVFDPDQSPKPTSGFYAVYLVAADASGVYLSLNQGTEHVTAHELKELVEQARTHLGVEPGSPMDLRSQQAGGRPRKYEQADIFHWWYPADSDHVDDDLSNDLNGALAYLDRLRSLSASEAVQADVEVGAESDPSKLRSVTSITLEHLAKAVEDRSLSLPTHVLERTIAALRAGKHLLLTGPPGTGKTTFGEAVCAAAVDAGVAVGWNLTTATADWTSTDTVGGYWMNLDKDLEFKPGAVVASVRAGSWLVIDELNRADVDKAFGQLFSALSGQAVRLPFEAGKPPTTLSLVPHGANPPTGTRPIHIAGSWRLIATINTRDRDFLFNLSFALLRRFAVIDIPAPDPDAFAALALELAETGEEPLNDAVRALSRIHAPEVASQYGRACGQAVLGPAIIIDLGRYLRHAADIATTQTTDQLLADALNSFAVPQWEHLAPYELSEVSRYLSDHYFYEMDAKGVAEQLEAALGVAIDQVGDNPE